MVCHIWKLCGAGYSSKSCYETLKYDVLHYCGLNKLKILKSDAVTSLHLNPNKADRPEILLNLLNVNVNVNVK